MRPDILDLERFYRSQLGETTRRLINVEIRRVWPTIPGDRVLGIGYAVPYLRQLSEAECTLALMPATQGVWPWPNERPSLTALGREDELPFDDQSFERIILAHALECSPHTNRLLREVWRILSDGGSFVAIVPNRKGLWCWNDRTPFSSGQPFNRKQLEKLVHSHLFQITQTRSALIMPPWPIGWARRMAVAFERIGLYLAPGLAGVYVIEAQKRVYVPNGGQPLPRPSSRRYTPFPVG